MRTIGPKAAAKPLIHFLGGTASSFDLMVSLNICQKPATVPIKKKDNVPQGAHLKNLSIKIPIATPIAVQMISVNPSEDIDHNRHCCFM
jgi:hypothetical protein